MILDPSRFGDSRGPRQKRGGIQGAGRYHHPLGWYSVSVPPGWVIADRSEPVRILTAEEDAAVVISIAKAAPGTKPRAASLDAIEQEVPGLHVIERRNRQEGETRGMRYAQVEEVVGERPPWWKLWRKPVAESHILTACFSRGDLFAMVTLEVPPERVDRHRLAAGALFGSFELVEHPIPSPEEFLARFFAIARARLPQKQVVATGPLAVAIDGAPLALEQHYRALTCDPEIGDGVFERIFAFLETEEPPRTNVSYDEVRDSIVMTIKPREWVENADRNVPEPSRVLRMPFPNDTALVFVVDHPHVMRFVSVEESERWEVPPKEMFGVAKRNLLRMKPQLCHRAILDPTGRVSAIAIAEGDGYDASRILLPGLFEQLRERLGESFALAIPNRDLLIAFVTDDEKVVDAIQRRIAEDVSKRPYPISDQFFRLTPEGGVEPY
ncbi:MAG TPA: DUF1444 family protein [Planctomycetota bacterium]|nr:DUF1444 family protein [Planctomycetota bacterium]